jgi:hypothetical protein
MATKTKRSTKKKPAAASADGPYLLKLVLYTIIGTQWLWFETSSGSVPVPIGLLLGIVFATHEHFQVDRKIEYAVLLAAMLAGFVAKVGVFVNI